MTGARPCGGLGGGGADGVDRNTHLETRIHRVAIAYLLASAWCCRYPCWSRGGTRIFIALTRGARTGTLSPPGLDKQATNTQLWWALAAGLPVCWWLRRFTRAPVFSLMFSSIAALLCLATLLRMACWTGWTTIPGVFIST